MSTAEREASPDAHDRWWRILAQSQRFSEVAVRHNSVRVDGGITNHAANAGSVSFATTLSRAVGGAAEPAESGASLVVERDRAHHKDAGAVLPDRDRAL